MRTPKEEVTVGPVEAMHDFESRKPWQHVARGIREGDYELASREKSKIEVCIACDHWLVLLWAHPVLREFLQNDQRQRRRDEQAAGTRWQLKHFEHIESDPVCEFPFTTLPPSSCAVLIRSFADERLGQLFNANPPKEDTYVFMNNRDFPPTV